MRSPRTRKDSMAMMQNKATPAIMLGNTASTTINRLFQRAISNAFFHQVIIIFPGLTSARAGLEVARFVTLVRPEWSIAKGVTALSHSELPRRYLLIRCSRQRGKKQVCQSPGVA